MSMNAYSHRPKYNMPKKLKDAADAEPNLREMLRLESLNYSRQMQKVPPVLRLENDSEDYDPMVVALGPYHHGKEHLLRAEKLKVKTLQQIILDTRTRVQYFFDEVFERVDDVRSFYSEGSTNGYSDSVFAQMMLLDACFIISYMQSLKNPKFAAILLGEFGGYSAIIQRDLFLLENQIPFWFLKLVMYLGYGSKADGLVDEYIYKFSDFSRSNRKQIASYNPDIHLLDACRRVLLSERDENKPFIHPCCKFRFVWCVWTYVSRWLMTRWVKEKYHDDYTRKQEKNDDEYTWEEQDVLWFRSALDLKAKGIHLKPSRDYSLTGLCFKSGNYYPQLQLPILYVSPHTQVFFSNLIAYESFLDPTERKVTAYVNFMKSLIVHADDVKELREKGILFTSLGSYEEVAKMFKEINTSILSTERTIEEVRVKIQEYIRSKFKSWLGEFMYTYFGSPWTAIGTVAAIILLLLTLVQTCFAMRGS